MSETFSIGDLSREYEVTPRAIRFYEDAGLLSPGRNGRTRVFSPRDRIRLKLILRGKRLGFSLNEIREILDLYDAPSGEQGQLHYFMQKIRERRGHLEQQRKDIKAILKELEGIEDQCKDLLAASGAD
ncbi:MAG: MerR family transcriptional regulator [Gammaproteobacteria bacterium]|nr:MAG: MerR family transcriptional regulator [Gammaproteobacteria bacterium]